MSRAVVISAVVAYRLLEVELEIVLGWGVGSFAAFDHATIIQLA
jgi:hypothetical protein